MLTNANRLRGHTGCLVDSTTIRISSSVKPDTSYTSRLIAVICVCGDVFSCGVRAVVITNSPLICKAAKHFPFPDFQNIPGLRLDDWLRP
ncbi:MAG: hypothetical protein ACJ8FY_20500 [Gemmataceae bacterium]